jgi:uncharacterized protein YndB with AHSA1/START domain
MAPSTTEQAFRTIDIAKEEQIAAPIETVFETLLEQLGPLNETGPGSPMPMTLEAWPGGRWFRDLGKDTGHLWGHVQVIKPPVLLEISGPLFMSYPAVSHLQYRLTGEGGTTRLKFIHRGFGQITPEHQEGVGRGWSYILGKIREGAERRRDTGRKTL